MNLTDSQWKAIEDIAKELGVEAAALAAVVEVESNGVIGSTVEGQFMPIIRYEGHYFDRLCKPYVRSAAREAGVSDPRVGGIKNPSSQASRWALVRKAASFDSDAAYSACSYGVGQVMGSHWKKLGYSSVNDLIQEAQSGFRGQVYLMAKFIKAFDLVDELKARDWSGFARAYNGPLYAQNKYDTKMASAYARYAKRGPKALEAGRSGNLRLGSIGPGVRDVQGLLVHAGYSLKVDGDFGPATRDAVKEFQRSVGLTPDGIVGPKTQAKLSELRATAPEDVGQQKVSEIEEVKQGTTVAIAIPAIVTSVKEELGKVVETLTPYPYLNTVAEYLHTGIVALTVGGIIIGAGYALYGVYKSRKSVTGTK